jgi:uncharacterized protein (DUF1501 family)
MDTHPCDCTVSRRGFLGAGLWFLAAPRLLSADQPPMPRARFLLIVNLRGGNDGLNMVVPVLQQAYYDRRPTIRILPAEALTLDTGPYATRVAALHPSLTSLATLWAEGSLAIVPAAGYPSPNLSHFESMDIWSRGLRNPLPGQQDSGWIARYKDRNARETLGVVGLGTGRLLDFQGGQTRALVLSSLADYGFDLDPNYPASSRVRNEIVRDVARTHPGSGVVHEIQDAQATAFDQLDTLQEALRNYRSTIVYPPTSIASRLKDAAILLQAGLTTRLVYVQTGGFDTHGGQGGATGTHASLLLGLDRALGAFASDLKQLGIWNDAVIVVLSEFGRRNDENGSRGTDHGSGSPMLMLGGAVRGGLYGREIQQADLLQGHLPYDVDFRSVFKEVIARHLGADPAPVFPERQEREHNLGFVL